MGLILCIESSGSICSVSLTKKGSILAYKFVEEPNGHSKHLATLISALFERSNYSISGLDAVAVSGGPGSYTGLRIGVVMAKGICYALDIPLIALDTLSIMAHQFMNTQKVGGDTVLSPCVDARRMEVYTAVFDLQNNPILASQPMVLTEQSFSEILSKQKVMFFGSGATKMEDVIQHKNAVFHLEAVNPTAQHMALLAQEKYKDKDFEDVAYYNPNYLKPVYITRPQKAK
jgi:tRNA threonylcarbamoyladenosine biosynthesis protein TsaB